MSSPLRTSEVDEALAEVARYADAARRVLLHRTLDDRDRARALGGLLASAKRSRVPSLAVEAVLRQVDASIDGTLHEPPRPIGDGFIRRQRVLRALGYESCPTCAARVADEDEVRRLEGWWR